MPRLKKKNYNEGKTTITIDKAVHEQLKAVAAKEGKLIARVAEDAIKKGLEKSS